MIIHLAANAATFEKDLPYVREVQSSITDHQHELSLDWIDSTRTRLLKGEVKNEDLDWTRVVNEHLEAISRADLVIVEASAYSFHHGFQSAYALMKRKPILFLYREAEGKRNLRGLYASGITNELFSTHTYTNAVELRALVDTFLDTHSQPKQEVSLQLDSDLEEYLHMKATKNRTTKSAIIRDLLLDDQARDRKGIL